MQELFKHLIWEVQGSIAVLTISRPKALNALNMDLLKELDVWSTKIRSELEQSTNPIRSII